MLCDKASNILSRQRIYSGYSLQTIVLLKYWCIEVKHFLDSSFDVYMELFIIETWAFNKCC